MEPQTPPELVLLVKHLQDAPVTARQIAHWTVRDPLLSRVSRYIQEGWPGSNDDEELKSYWLKRVELLIHERCILWEGRVVVPGQGREWILGELHTGQPEYQE